MLTDAPEPQLGPFARGFQAHDFIAALIVRFIADVALVLDLGTGSVPRLIADLNVWNGVRDDRRNRTKRFKVHDCFSISLISPYL